MTAPFLFDPLPFGAGTEPRQRHEPEIATAINRGDWFLILRKGKEPYPLAHKLLMKITTITARGKQHVVALEDGARWEGGWRTRCGINGAALDLPTDSVVQVCPKCR